jgi:hypothetical protein
VLCRIWFFSLIAAALFTEVLADSMLLGLTG